jgi:hypothetical protein
MGSASDAGPVRRHNPDRESNACRHNGQQQAKEDDDDPAEHNVFLEMKPVLSLNHGHGAQRHSFPRR